MRLQAGRALFTLALGVLGAGCRPAPSVVLVPPVPRLEQVLPVDFPAVAQAARVSGVVDIEVDVLADGSVRGDTVRVVRGVPLLDQAAIDAARRARFRCDACGVDGATSRLRFDFRADQAGIADRVDWLVDGIRIVVFAKALVLQPAGQPAGAATSPALRLRAPIYPQIAQSARVEGGVTVDVEVQPDGSISAARVTRDIPLLSAAVLDALRQSASSCTNCATPVRRTLVYDFRLTDEPAKPPLDAGDHVVIEINARPPLVMPRMASSTDPPPTIAAPRPVPAGTPRLVPLWIARPAYP